MITITDPIYFNGTDINSISGWLTTSTTTYVYPSRNVNVFGIVNSDNSITSNAYFDGNKITVEGVIRVSGRENLDDSLSQLKKILKPINKTLQLPISGEQRKYTNSTVENIAITDVAGGFAKISIQFITKEPYSRALTSTTLLNVANLTSGDVSYPVTFTGSGLQLPIIQLTFDSGSPTSNRTVTFTNPYDDTYIAIQRDWTASDVIVIDCDNKQVLANDSAIDFEGKYLEFNDGAGFINYTDDFTTRQVDITVTYTERQL